MVGDLTRSRGLGREFPLPDRVLDDRGGHRARVKQAARVGGADVIGPDDDRQPPAPNPLAPIAAIQHGAHDGGDGFDGDDLRAGRSPLESLEDVPEAHPDDHRHRGNRVGQGVCEESIGFRDGIAPAVNADHAPVSRPD